jgi:hypothetical protein
VALTWRSIIFFILLRRCAQGTYCGGYGVCFFFIRLLCSPQFSATSSSHARASRRQEVPLFVVFFFFFSFIAFFSCISVSIVVVVIFIVVIVVIVIR